MNRFPDELTRKQMIQLAERVCGAATLAMPQEISDFLADWEMDDMLQLIREEVVYALERADNRKYDEWLSAIPEMTPPA